MAATYPADLLKMLKDSDEETIELVLPHPLEEIFPEESGSHSSDDPRQGLMKGEYETLVSATFRGKT